MKLSKKPQKPRLGWIYFVNPHVVVKKCRAGHISTYHLEAPGFELCKKKGCNEEVNTSHIQRGEHPYIIWTSQLLQDAAGSSLKTFIVIPLTSQTTFTGLPTTYPLAPNAENGLSRKSYALISQMQSLDASCLRDRDGNWKEKVGVLGKKDKDRIHKRICFALDTPKDDSFMGDNPQAKIKDLFQQVPEDGRSSLIEELIGLLQ